MRRISGYIRRLSIFNNPQFHELRERYGNNDSQSEHISSDDFNSSEEKDYAREIDMNLNKVTVYVS